MTITSVQHPVLHCSHMLVVDASSQVNYLGYYTLMRLIEGKLIASKSRVVTISSVLHRLVALDTPEAFLFQWRKGSYMHCKLAAVVFAFELQRRLGGYGVQSCVADAGGQARMASATSQFSLS